MSDQFPDHPATQLERELRDQGAALERRAATGRLAAAEAAAVLERPDVHYVCVAARGSSDNAARYARYALGMEAQLNVAIAAPSLFTGAQPPPDLRGAAVMAISQSGQSPDIVSVLAAGRAQGRPTIAITNDERSPVAAEADVVIPLATGAEHAVAATKTYVASLHAIHQLLEAMRPSPERREWLERLPGVLDEMTKRLLARRSRFDALDRAACVTVGGRGLDYATAHETAHKIRELAALTTEAFSPPDLLHGAIAGLDHRGWFWLLASEATAAAGGAGALLETIAARNMPTVVVSADPALCARGRIPVALPSPAPRWVAAIAAVVPGQVAALRLAELRDVTIDRPHGLSKVTLTL